MKPTSPITGFFFKMQSFLPNDIAVLFGMVAMQESMPPDELIPPFVSKRLWCVQLSEQELSESLERLAKLGEVEWIEDDVNGVDRQGYCVTRFEELQKLISEFGRKAYFSAAAEKRKQLVS